MKKASITILKAQLSRYLDVVKAGEEVIVTERGRPVARLVPIDRADLPTGRVAQLVREGRMRSPSKDEPMPGEGDSRPRDPDGRSLDILLEERTQDR